MTLFNIPIEVDDTLLPNAVKFRATNGEEIVLVNGVEAVEYHDFTEAAHLESRTV